MTATIHSQLELAEIKRGKGFIVKQRIEQGIHAGQHGERVLRNLGDETGDVARVGNQQIAGADLEEGEAVRGQRKDMIKR